uniref:Uncharacterized protein n=1 Tax=Ditylenchus dipsaci TaxID=166011 RepID=A0A915EHZ5_9BILA
MMHLLKDEPEMSHMNATEASISPSNPITVEEQQQLVQELYKIAETKWKWEDFFSQRKEFLSEYAEFTSTEEFIHDTQKTINELNQEKDAHSELIQQINQDRADLENVISEVKEEHSQSKRALNEKFELISNLYEQTSHLVKDAIGSEAENHPETLLSPSLIPQSLPFIAAPKTISSKNSNPSTNSSTAEPCNPRVSSSGSQQPAAVISPSTVAAMQAQYLNQFKSNPAVAAAAAAQMMFNFNGSSPNEQARHSQRTNRNPSQQPCVPG